MSHVYTIYVKHATMKSSHLISTEPSDRKHDMNHRYRVHMLTELSYFWIHRPA